MAPQTAEGGSAALGSAEDKRRAVELAFDYRGDVTVTLESGEAVVGYLFNRDFQSAQPFVEMYAKGEPAPRRIAASEIVGVAFTGPDPAAGRSWKEWLETVTEAEAAGKIAEQYPEPLDDPAH